MIWCRESLRCYFVQTVMLNTCNVILSISIHNQHSTLFCTVLYCLRNKFHKQRGKKVVGANRVQTLFIAYYMSLYISLVNFHKHTNGLLSQQIWMTSVSNLNISTCIDPFSATWIQYYDPLHRHQILLLRLLKKMYCYYYIICWLLFVQTFQSFKYHNAEQKMSIINSPRFKMMFCLASNLKYSNTQLKCKKPWKIWECERRKVRHFYLITG